MLRNKLTADSSPENRVIINSEIKFTDDDICCLLFGMNKEQFVKDICDNRGGKYDNLYAKEKTS